MAIDVIPVKVQMEGVEYVGYYHGKVITRGRSVETVVKKLHKYIKGQS